MKELRDQTIPYKIYLTEDEMPKYWYNVRADMTNKPAPLLNPGTLKPMTAEELGGVFCAELVKQEMGIEFDEESLHYERFVTHLKFLAQRLYRHELLKDEEIEFAKLMEGKYPGEYECSKHIAEYIEKEYGGQISGEEIMFLAIHIKRVCMTD